MLQNYQQLKKQYGDDAETIFSGGVRTKLVYSGLDVETSKIVQEMLGKVVVEQKGNGTKQRREDNLMNADQIRQIEEDQALCVSSNRKPVLLKTVPSFRDPQMKKIMSMPPTPYPDPIAGKQLHYVTL